VQKVGYLLSPPTWRFFGDFRCFVSHVILALFGSFCSCIIICALRWGIYCPLLLGNFLGDCWKFWFARNYLCPSVGYLLSPLTHPSNLAIFGDFRKFYFARNFFALRFRVFIVPSNLPLQLGIFLEIFGSFVLRIIICAL
jgi:hypothetical protein